MSLLELTPVTFTDRLLEIKVQNITNTPLDKRLVIEISPPAHLVDDRIVEAAREAAVSEDPPGAKSLAGIVTGPTGWSVWVRREASDSSLIIVFINDMDQNGRDLEKPVPLAARAESVLRIPLDPDAERGNIQVLYSYQHGKNESDPIYDGKLILTPETWMPDVTLSTDATSPTAIKPGTKVKVIWHITDGVSATLRGPLPGGNTELSLSSDPAADFKISGGEVEVRVMSGTTYVLQAEVKRPGKPNLQVVRMLWLDTLNQKYTYLATQRTRVLLNGLIEIDWAAWGVKQVMLTVSDHTTRVVRLTQQTLGRFYEGSGVMRVSATRRISETIDIEALNFEGTPQHKNVTVITWKRMTKPVLTGQPLGMSVIAPKLMVLTSDGLFIADVGEVDPTTPPEQLAFSRINTPAPAQWLALTAVLRRFVTLRRTRENDLEVAPYKVDGTSDEIPPLNLPGDLRPLVGRSNTVFDLVGFGGRAYVVVEAAMPGGPVRRAFSVGFDGTTKKAEYRPEPLLESLPGYKLVTFDNALYALHRASGRMLRIERSLSGALEPPLSAASAITKRDGAAGSMIRDGLILPVGRLLVVLCPNAVPTLEEVEAFGLRNVLPYSTTGMLRGDPDTIPQDLFYNPQKNYWGRCGHDLDVKPGAVAVFRGGGSPRLWVIQPDGETYTLAVGSESLFAHDYWSECPTKKLPEYLNKTRKFTITNKSGFRLLPLGATYANAGLVDFSAGGPAELTSRLPNPFNFISTASFELKCNETDPVPVCLRFLAGPRYGGVKYQYMLELTLSGPNLSTATSVFKGIAVDGSGAVSIAEIPGTMVQHSTEQPIVIPEAKPLVENLKLRIHNLTSYQLLRTSPLGGDPYRYNFEENIHANTTPFSVLAHGTGTLPIDLDFSLPKGIEISPGSEPQRKQIRINTAQKGALHAELLPSREENTYEFKISYRLTRELQCVYASDPVASEDGAAIYAPVALPQDQTQMQVWHIDVDYLAQMPSSTFTSSGIFSLPNTVALADEYMFAMFGDTNIHVLNYGLQLQETFNVNNSYTVVTGIEANLGSNTHFLLGMKQDKVLTQNIIFHYILGSKLIMKATSGPRKITWGDVKDISLDAVKGFRDQIKMPGSPSWVSTLTVSPMAVSPSVVSPRGERVKEVAICIDGGLFLIGKSEQDIRSLKLDSVGREEDIVFGREGRSIYCLHSSMDTQTLRVSRVDNQQWKLMGSLSLPRGEGVADLTTDLRRREPGLPYKNHRSASLVRTPDEKLLFVSHGKSIFKIDTATMTLRDTYTLDLPCRVFHAWYGKPEPGVHPIYGGPASCILLYAIGASYRGDGTRAREFKTQIYKIGILDK